MNLLCVIIYIYANVLDVQQSAKEAEQFLYKTHKSKLTSTFTHKIMLISHLLYEYIDNLLWNCGLLCTTIPNDYNKFIIFELIVLNIENGEKKELKIKISLKCMKNRNSIVNYEIRDDDWWVNGI